MKKKLKRKHNTYAKSVHVSCVDRLGKKGKNEFNLLKIMQFFSCLLSMYRSARELGWFEHLPALVEKLGVVLKYISLVFKKFI